MNLWLVGLYRDDGELKILGVFSSEGKALVACTHMNHWIGPLVLDERLSDDWIPWPGAYYPALEDKPEGEDK